MNLLIDDLRLSIKKNKKENTTSNMQNIYRFQSTQDIIDAAEAGFLPDRIMITVHPQRWSDSVLSWIRELVFQNVKNVIKNIIVKRNQRKSA